MALSSSGQLLLASKPALEKQTGLLYGPQQVT